MLIDNFLSCLFDLSIIERCVLKYPLTIVDFLIFPCNSVKFCFVYLRLCFFPVVMYGCESWTIKKLSGEELMPLNCGVGEDC